jgi:phage tail sheath protein FI
MAISTFPGVFIQEVPSSVRTITGVPTAIAAFVGRTTLGPVNEPIIINNFGQFEREFGGLAVDSSIGYAVKDFFSNGGGQGVVARLYRLPGGAPIGATGAATITFDPLATPAVLRLKASSPGTWVNTLKVIPSLETASVRAQIADSLGLPATTASADSIFSLRIEFGTNVETIQNLTLIESPRRYDKVLALESRYVRAVAPPATGDNTDAKLLLTPGTGSPPGPSTPKVPVIAGALASDPLQRTDYQGSIAAKTGVPALEKTDLFNILCIPPDVRGADGWTPTDPLVFSDALDYARGRRAMLVIDPPKASSTQSPGDQVLAFLANLNLSGDRTQNAVAYFPRVLEADPLRSNTVDGFAVCGVVAGVMARTDAERGVWKAPAGIDAGMSGITGLERNLTDADNGRINPVGVNALRSFPIIGNVVWGARTLRGADELGDQYKYLPVRRVALFIEESLFRGTKFAVFEPNDEPLWAQLRLNIGAFLNNLFRQGAFQGQSTREAYFVKCDKETTTQNDINLGVVNILVGFAPLKPAEFVVIKIQQIAGQIAA